MTARETELLEALDALLAKVPTRTGSLMLRYRCAYCDGHMSHWTAKGWINEYKHKTGCPWLLAKQLRDEIS